MLEEVSQEQTSVAKKQCDGCQVCCMVLPVPELNKPPRRSCAHQCQTGCNVYDKKPASCSQFECLWKLADDMGPETRPDKCGVMFDVYSPEKLLVALSRGFSWKNKESSEVINKFLGEGYVVWVRSVALTHLVLPVGVKEDEAVRRLSAVKERMYGGS